MIRAMAPQAMEMLLDRQATQLEALIGASEALQHAVINNDSPALNAAMERLNSEQKALEAVERERMDLMVDEGFTQDTTMGDYILKATEDRRETLTQRYARLSNLLLNLKDMQAANTLLLREGLTYIQVQLSAMTPKHASTGLYSRQAKMVHTQGAALDTRG